MMVLDQYLDISVKTIHFNLVGNKVPFNYTGGLKDVKVGSLVPTSCSFWFNILFPVIY